MSGTYDPNPGIIWYVPRSGTGVCPLLASNIERVVPGDMLFRGKAVDLDIHYLITRDRRIIEYRYMNDEFDDESITYREISPADFIAANCPPDGRLPPDLSWIRTPQAPMSDPARETTNPPTPSRESPPEADTIQTAGENKSPAAPAFPDPLNQTLGKLKGSSAAKNLIRFLAHQTDQKATLVDTARHRNSGRREPTRRNISSTKQQVRRTAANLELRDAPLRIEYCWIQQIISLVDWNGNPPALHINEIADVAK